jgi:predicted aspartyl protease
LAKFHHPIKGKVSSFTVVANGLLRTLETPAIICKAYNPLKEKAPSKPKQYSAIWDTGATGSVITEKVVTECGLAPIDRTKVYTASGEDTTEVYLVNIGLPNNVIIGNVRVSKGNIFGHCEVLIGMDIISRGDFACTNKNKKTVFSFRFPSIDKIDFVKQKPTMPTTAKKTVPKVGRNAPCPCGSGKKYKKCCGK